MGVSQAGAAMVLVLFLVFATPGPGAAHPVATLAAVAKFIKVVGPMFGTVRSSTLMHIQPGGGIQALRLYHTRSYSFMDLKDFSVRAIAVRMAHIPADKLFYPGDPQRTAEYVYELVSTSREHELDTFVRLINNVDGRGGYFIVTAYRGETTLELEILWGDAEFEFTKDMQIWQESKQGFFRSRTRVEIRYTPAALGPDLALVDMVLTLPETRTALRIKHNNKARIEEALLMARTGGPAAVEYYLSHQYSADELRAAKPDL